LFDFREAIRLSAYWRLVCFAQDHRSTYMFYTKKHETPIPYRHHKNPKKSSLEMSSAPKLAK